ncbi:Cas1p-domain-containing protein [Sodiomyces alkalinus F11]|uniref:Cas1p-domain-containing protein n=1 Tax=Sodiomyces alkalinus (strain CBS 110278 / VKM F-3762 / F11) TaxID=1314773 RepID=A0A3N2Q5A2_SODAK|nr:Cas1p-domain-containing protein [Sodiomyces alkalinus F11]ROT41954.1 Cas1p-domain-containing protein [Sodiomyces alkalinus F11]
MESLFSRLLRIVAGALFVLIIAHRTFLFHHDDPYRCRPVLNSGYWADPPDENGSRAPFENWRVDGCLLHQYSSEDIRQCFQGRYALFGGDSTTRQVAFGLGRLLERDEAVWQHKHMDIHRSFNLTYHGVQIQQHWNPYLKIAGEEPYEAFGEQVELIGREHKNPPTSFDDQEGPALVMLGVGAWFTKPSNGYEDPVEAEAETMRNVSDAIGNRRDWLREPMHPIDGIGNQVFFAPPSGPYYTGDDAEKRKERLAMGSKVKEIQNWMATDISEGDYNLDLAWALAGTVEDQNDTFVDPHGTGFHVTDGVAETKANILLNLRCNAVLDRIQGYPYTRTCCTDYGNKNLTQTILVAAGMIYLTACVLFDTANLVVTRQGKPRVGWSWLGMDTGAFVMAVLMCFYADRTQLFAKKEKNWSWTDFIVFSVPSIILALITIRKSKPPPPRRGGADNPAAVDPTKQADQPFLSREQTDEWKGWMQALILIYHWTSAKHSSSIYIFVRLCVAAYLFQTGYGHTTYFLKKKDFSFHRVASVLLRLNLLPCTLIYFMNTDYMFYYFSPLCSFWFLIVYLTLAFVLAKTCISAVLVAVTMLATPLNRWAFWVLRTVFHIQWSVQEWEYRVALDLFVVYTGMLAALAYVKLKEDVRAPLRWAMALLGSAVIGGYSYASVSVSVADYRHWHPYTAFVPIFAFIAVRNVSGPCSLETYTLQFHMFLAADTKAVLLVDGLFGGGDYTILGDRWRSLVVVVPVFIWVSSITATATGHLVKLLLTTPTPPDNGGHHASPDSSTAADLEKNEEGFEDDSRAGLLGASRSAVSRWRRTKYIPTMRSIAYSPQARIVLIFLIMWFLNLIQSIPDRTVPDGYTPTNAVKAQSG